MQKFFAVLLVISLASLVSSQDLFSFKEPTESLFVSAWEYQGKFSDLQIEINEKVYEIQTSVSKVLAITTNKTLTQIDDNAKSFVELDETVREVLNPLMPDGCISDLLEILDGVTHMSGFDSSNCLRHYDVSLQAEIANFTEALATYGNLSAEIQQIVVRAFIGKC